MSKEKGIKRRDFLKMTGAAMGAAAVGGPYVVRAQSKKPIKIAIVQALSGPLSRNGNLGLQGAKGYVKWLNDQGGIKSMGGRPLQLLWADSGSSPESNATAMERLCRDPEICMASDGWASSFEMGSTEVTERLGIPQFNTGFSPALHTRGFKWGFYVSPPAMQQGEIGLTKIINLARGAGQVVKTAMLVGDNQAASKGYYEACRKLLPPMGIKIIGEEVWAMGTLTDATAVMQKVKTMNPDVVMFMATAISECQMCLMKKKELGVDIPFIGNGAWLCDPTFLQAGVEALEGLVAFSPCFPHKKTPQVWIDYIMKQCKAEYSDEPFFAQELCWPLCLYPIMREMLEIAGTTDRQRLLEVGHEIDFPPGHMAGSALAGQGVKFDETGRMHPKYHDVVVVQWQSGRPKTIWPPTLAVAEPLWKFTPKK